MDKPLVSVIVPNYNYAQYLRETLDSVLAQTYPNIEIIVVDDGSEDESKTILNNYGVRIHAIFQQNKGVAIARNKGVEASHGEYVAFLDADDAWLPSKIELQVEQFCKTEEPGLVHVGVVEIDDRGQEIKRRLHGGEGREVWREMLHFSDSGILGGGSGAMIKRQVFEELGGFDERLSTSADWDVYYRISKRYPIGFVPKPLLRYRVHSSNMHGNISAMEHDMIIAFDKAFSDPSPELLRIKRTAYGTLHQNLAGSYFAANNHAAFLRHAIRGLALNPRNIKHFLKLPKTRRGR